MLILLINQMKIYIKLNFGCELIIIGENSLVHFIIILINKL